MQVKIYSERDNIGTQEKRRGINVDAVWEF